VPGYRCLTGQSYEGIGIPGPQGGREGYVEQAKVRPMKTKTGDLN
jgi:hypothetical protein